MQLVIQWRKRSLPAPAIDTDSGEDCDPNESVITDEICEPFFPLRMTV